jgi:hypothetical protein
VKQDQSAGSPEAQGYAAFVAGKPSTENPFAVGSMDSRRWDAGWLKGEDGSPTHPGYGVRLWRFRVRGDHIVLFAIAAVVGRYFFWDELSRLPEQPGHLSIFILAMLVMVAIVTYSGPTRR